MAAAQVLLEHLELAGICCKDFKAPLQKACQHSDAAAVLDWLGRLTGGNLLSDKQALLLQNLDTKAGKQGYDHTQHASTEALITAVQRELESQKLLDAYPSEDEVQQIIANQEATLLQLQSKLKSLQALSSATKKQSIATAQSIAVSGHDQRISSRRDSNAKRLAGQQDACNTLLRKTEKTAALLQAKFEQHSSSWLLSLSDMQIVHQQDAKFRTEMDRLYKKQFQSGPAASIHEQHTSSDWLYDHDPLQPDSLHNVLRGPDSQAYEDHVQELDRLRWIHEASQMQHVTTLAWQAKQEAMLESTRVSISRAASVQEPGLMQAELTHLTAELKKLTAHKQQLLHDQLPAMCNQRPFVTANQSGHTPKCHLSKQSILTSLAHRRGSVKAEAAGLDEGVTASSGLLGPSTQSQRKSSSPEPAGDVGGVELASEVDMDYSSLRDALQQGDFQQADDLTRAALITLAGPDAEKRNWVYFSEVKFISNTDLQTIDKLWRAASKNRQGFSIQKEMWMQNRKQWTKFFKQIDWTVGEFNNYRKWPQDFIYDMSAAKGHLPLTNALRGTQLFKAILEHPAFEKADSNGSNGSTPDWLK
ncbi:hypothetical protein WJX82_006427 [Trebouxia sp. C0006]